MIDPGMPSTRPTESAADTLTQGRYGAVAPDVPAVAIEQPGIGESIVEQYRRLCMIRHWINDQTARFHPGDFVKMRDNNLESPEPRSACSSDLVYVTHLYQEQGTLMFKGHTSIKGYVRTIVDEAWRFEQVQVYTFA